MDRFDGEKLVNRPVSDGIRKPEELIQLATNDTAPVFHGEGKDGAADEEMLMAQLVKESIKI